MKKPFKIILVLIVLLVIIGVFFGIAAKRFKELEKKAQQLGPVERPPLPVRAVKTQQGSIEQWILGEGTARTVRRKFLNFETSGEVVFIAKDAEGNDLRVGSWVHGPLAGEEYGQLLAHLDQREQLVTIDISEARLEQARHRVTVSEATVAQAENEYNLAQLDFERVARLSEEGTTILLREETVAQSQQKVTGAEAAVAQAESDFKLAKADLERTERLSKEGATLKTYETALTQARQNVDVAKASVAKAQNDYNLAKENFEKAEKLYKDGIIAKTRYDEANTQYLNAGAALETAKARLASARSAVENANNELNKAKINVPVTEVETARARYRSAEAALKQVRAQLESTKSDVKKATTELTKAKIDTPVIELETARAKYLNAEASLKTAKAQFASAQSQVKEAVAQLEQVQLSLEQTSIYAPFDGIITYLNIKIGDYITPQLMDKSNEQALSKTAPIVVIDPTEYEITLNLPAYVGNLVTSQNKAFIVPAGTSFPEAPDPFETGEEKSPEEQEVFMLEEQFPMAQGQVYSVSPSISPGGRSVEIKIRATDGSEYLQDGMLVTCRIVVQEKDNVVIAPNNSLIFRESQAYLFVVDPKTGTASRQQFVRGIAGVKYFEIIEGIGEGEYVVTEGRHRLVNGARVEILNM